MKHGSDDIPAACRLTSAELRERAETLLAQFRSAVIGIEELRDGYAFRVPGEGNWIATIADQFGFQPCWCKAAASFSMVGNGNNVANGRFLPRVLSSSMKMCIATNESPPISKKSSVTPIGSIPSALSQMAASWASSISRGPTNSLSPLEATGSGSAERSIFPFALSGNFSRTTIAAGSM